MEERSAVGPGLPGALLSLCISPAGAPGTAVTAVVAEGEWRTSVSAGCQRCAGVGGLTGPVGLELHGAEGAVWGWWSTGTFCVFYCRLDPAKGLRLR